MCVCLFVDMCLFMYVGYSVSCVYKQALDQTNSLFGTEKETLCSGRLFLQENVCSENREGCLVSDLCQEDTEARGGGHRETSGVQSQVGAWEIQAETKGCRGGDRRGEAPAWPAPCLNLKPRDICDRRKGVNREGGWEGERPCVLRWQG